VNTAAGRNPAHPQHQQQRLEKAMPSTSEMIVSKFLRKEDVGDDDIAVTIKAVSLEDMPGDSGDKRWVLHFRELPKGMVMNSSTIKVCEKAFGTHTDNWTGGKVSLYVDPNVQFKGQVVGGLRLRPLRTAKATLAVLASKAAAEDFNDEVPA
jgi:hypothetical protein